MRVFAAAFVLGILANGAVFGQEPLAVEGKAVVFFAPSFQEMQGFSEQKQRNTEKSAADLRFYRDQVRGFLLANAIENIWTTSPTFSIPHPQQTFTLARNNFSHAVGVVLTDGEQIPKVFAGVSTYIELVLRIRRYFRLGTNPNERKEND